MVLLTFLGVHKNNPAYEYWISIRFVFFLRFNGKITKSTRHSHKLVLIAPLFLSLENFFRMLAFFHARFYTQQEYHNFTTTKSAHLFHRFAALTKSHHKSIFCYEILVGFMFFKGSYLLPQVIIFIHII